MATEPLVSSVSVGFGADNNGGLKRLVLESDGSALDEPKAGHSFVRVFPSYANPQVIAVRGTAARVGTKIPEQVEDYVSFSGSDNVNLQYPPTGPVVIHWGFFYQANPSVTYNEETASIVLSEEAHGIVKVTYTAFFDRYLIGHGDGPCVIYKARIDEDGAVPDYEPSFVVAIANGYEKESMQVSGPSCSSVVGTNNLTQNVEKGDYSAVGLRMEIDDQRPVGTWSEYFNANDTPDGFTLNAQTVTLNGKTTTLYCGCRVRVYPRISGVRLEGVNCAVSNAPVGEGTRPCLESLTFTGQQSTNLSYPPTGAVTLSKDIRDAATNFGNFVSVSLVGPGGRVNEVEWETASKFRRIQGRRLVRPDEVVVVTTGNNTVPCYTWGSARYESDYYLFDVLLNWSDHSGWYEPAMVLCIDANGQVGHLSIEPPAKGGVV